MVERMPALFFGHGKPNECAAGTPLYAAVGSNRCDPAETQSDTFGLGAEIHQQAQIEKVWVALKSGNKQLLVIPKRR
jgi:hypothetical protein